jgi:hypothetical protein
MSDNDSGTGFSPYAAASFDAPAARMKRELEREDAQSVPPKGV